MTEAEIARLKKLSTYHAADRGLNAAETREAIALLGAAVTELLERVPPKRRPTHEK